MRVEFNHLPGVSAITDALPYEVEDTGSVIYKRYTDGRRPPKKIGEAWMTDQPELIIRTTIEASGSTTLTRNEKAWAKWSERASAEYHPINEPAPNDLYA